MSYQVLGIVAVGFSVFFLMIFMGKIKPIGNQSNDNEKRLKIYSLIASIALFLLGIIFFINP